MSHWEVHINIGSPSLHKRKENNISNKVFAVVSGSKPKIAHSKRK